MWFPLASLICLAVALWFPRGERHIVERKPEAVLGTPEPSAIDHLLILRFFACSLVFLLHVAIFVPHLFEQDWEVLGSNIIWLVHAPGQIGVAIFFTLSGYLMAKGFFHHKYELGRTGFRRFLRNRALRIIPLYYFNIVVVALLVDPRLLTNHGCTELIRLVTFTYHASGPCNANQALWTISTEMEFYAVVPLIALAASWLGSPRTICAAMVTGLVFGPFIRWGLWLHIGKNLALWTESIYAQVYGNIDCFTAGFLICPLLAARGQPRRIYRAGYALLPLLYIAGSFWYYRSMHLGIAPDAYVVFFPSVAVLVALAFIWCLDPDPASRGNPLTLARIRERPMRVLEIGGLLTYSIYVWHPLILAKLAEVLHGSPAVMYLRLLAMGAICTVVFSAITYLCIERSVDRARA
jgi:peptidoglycan/LPS O-acetylase OafA/YrhL